ncbi:MAG: glucose 1-dehydrogenase [Rhodospirillaceae bacterium]|nr:glucose 1-dehydrogenase [Rhodospirillaceae bacterium]
MGVLSGKVIVVTGATSGIGKGSALRLAEAGAALVLTGRDRARGADVLDKVAAVGGRAIFVPLEVTYRSNWDALIEATLSAFGRVDVLVNNAGDAVMMPLAQLPLDAMAYLLDVNVSGPFLGIQAVWPHLRRQGGGLIVNVNSVAGLRGNLNGSAYCASKAAQLGLTRTAAAEGAADNIRVVSLHPGFILTEGLEETLRTNPAMLRPMIDTMIPTRTPGRPAQIGDALVYLCSDDARALNGVEIVVDGGMTAT